MTINIDFISAPDISIENDVINEFNHKVPIGCQLAAAGWINKGESTPKIFCEILELIFNSISKKLTKHEVWLFIGTSTWQPDTRVVRYHRLLSRLKLLGIDITPQGTFEESMIEKNGELKFFGAIPTNQLAIESIIRAVLSESCSYIVALPKKIDFKEILNIGWCNHISEDLNFIEFLAKQDGLIFKKVGEFDDLEQGFIGIGQLHLINKLIN